MTNKIVKQLYENNKRANNNEFYRYMSDIELLDSIVNKFDFSSNVEVYVPSLPCFSYTYNGKEYNKIVLSERVKPVKLSDGLDVMSDDIANHINKRVNKAAKGNDKLIFAPYQLPYLCRLVPPDERLGIIIRYGYIEISEDYV